MSTPSRMELRRTIIAEARAAVDLSLDTLDLAVLRRAFSELFDAAAADVTRAGYDLDDVVLDRFLNCRLSNEDVSAGSTRTCQVGTLTDHPRLVQDACQSLDDQIRGPASPEEIRIVGLRVAATLEQWT